MPTNLLLRSALVVGLGALAGGAAASSQAPSVAVTAAESEREFRIRYIQSFYQQVFLGRNTLQAHGYVIPTLIQHDPEIENGIDGFIKYYKQLFTTYPNYSAEIRRITASGDRVTVHVLERLNPWDRGNVQIHMYRMVPTATSAAIAEHWVVGNPIPATSLNANGLI
jgi:predicted SnoaL-like aldol condensation-catalyzing enzyme